MKKTPRTMENTGFANPDYQYPILLTTAELQMLRFSLEQASVTFRKRELFATDDATASNWAAKGDKAFALLEKIQTVSSVRLSGGARNL